MLTVLAGTTPGGALPLGGTQAGAATVLVPAQEPAPPPGKGPEFGNASPVGLVVVLVLLVATILLIRSMSKRIRRLPESFDEPDGDTAPAAASDSASGANVSDRTGEADGTDRA